MKYYDISQVKEDYKHIDRLEWAKTLPFINIVTCKDCKYYIGECSKHHGTKGPNFFCSEGETR